MMRHEAYQRFDWDEEKRASNLEKHGLDFQDASRLDWEHPTIVYSPRGNEPRWIAFMSFRDGSPDELYAVVYTLREDKTRLISFRRARNEEMTGHDSSD